MTALISFYTPIDYFPDSLIGCVTHINDYYVYSQMLILAPIHFFCFVLKNLSLSFFDPSLLRLGKWNCFNGTRIV